MLAEAVERIAQNWDRSLSVCGCARAVMSFWCKEKFRRTVAISVLARGETKTQSRENTLESGGLVRHRLQAGTKPEQTKTSQ